MRCSHFVRIIGAEFVVVKKPGGVENPDQQIRQPHFEGFAKTLEECALKKDKEQKKANAFDAEKIFGGEDAAELQQKRDDGVRGFFCAQGFEGKAERKQIKKKRNEFLIDVSQRDPMLTVTGEDEHEQRGEVGERFSLRKNLRESLPSDDAN